uniref:DUF1045 domain-containing protein n=1 Tax=Pararhizobium sp. IMCC3301 TaxID=3067904 RepID=UPI002741BB4B|nr:DUF1045 domain-containing protein [Pararhizobium sp. IMCC3301]
MRYAIFYTPPVDHAITRLAAAWLGRDAFGGEPQSRPVIPAFSAARLSELAKAPRRYGFHATLKAPFHLAEGVDGTQLVSALQNFARDRTAFAMPKLKVGRLGPFFALVPERDGAELNQFAADIVDGFEAFRAPLAAADYARRKPEQLSAQHRAYLQQWGYPYVFDAFRFHMTLTGPVPDAEVNKMEEALTSLFQPLLSAPLICDHLTLFCERQTGGPFMVHTSIPLKSSLSAKAATS